MEDIKNIKHKINLLLEEARVLQEDVERELLLLPKLMYQLRELLLSQSKALNETIALRKSAELRVSNEVYKQSKDKFPNAQARENEINKKCNEDTQVQQLKSTEKKQREEVEITKNDLEYIDDRFKAVRSIAPFYYTNEQK